MPYWWDNKGETLAATIYKHRPDLFSVRPKGQPMQKNTLTKRLWKLLPDYYYMKPSQDPTGYYMFPKQVGKIAYWDGETLYGKNGNAVTVEKGLPNDITLEAVLSHANKLWVYDAPSLPISDWIARIAHLKGLKKTGHLPSFVHIVDVETCRGLLFVVESV